MFMCWYVLLVNYLYVAIIILFGLIHPPSQSCLELNNWYQSVVLVVTKVFPLDEQPWSSTLWQTEIASKCGTLHSWGWVSREGQLPFQYEWKCWSNPTYMKFNLWILRGERWRKNTWKGRRFAPRLKIDLLCL